MADKPSSLADAIALILDEFPETDLREWASRPKLGAVSDAHFGLGAWIRNQWVYGEGCPLVFKLHQNSLACYHEDEISSVILEGLWRFLNGEKDLTI